MNQLDSITVTPQHATFQTAVSIVPDLAANITKAQAAGDFAYAMAKDAGYSLEAQAEEYHLAYTETMRKLGMPMPCNCDYCRADTAADRLSGWLMVPVQIR